MITLLILVTVTLLSAISYNIYQNNKDAKWPDDQQIDMALTKSIKWLQTNKSFIESDHNSALWWMLKEASDISDETDLPEIYSNYKKSYLDKQPLNIWSAYFSPYYKPVMPDIAQLKRLSPYKLFFAYALSCDNDLASEPVIHKQLQSNFCSLHYLHSRCVTHQQMGVRLLQKRNCGDQQQLAGLSSELIDLILSELTWDFRVGDAYLQRNLVLAESGRSDLIKAVWIQRILKAQNPDGGWDDIHPIITLDGTVLGLSSKKPVFKRAESSFHATAQGIWLLSLLQQNNDKKISTKGTANK